MDRLFSILPTPFILCLLAICLWSCATEGEGGTATLEGLIIATEYDVFGDPFVSYPAPEERVYIVYGSEVTHGDDLRTNPEGTYQFPFLRKGKYTVYAYSDCAGCPSGKEAISVEIEINKRGALVNAPDINIRKN